MAQEWFYAQGDRKIGPVSVRELKQAAEDGTLQPTDLVWTEGMPEWKKARTIEELAESWSSTSAPALPRRSNKGRSGATGSGISLPVKLGIAGGGVSVLLVLLCCGGMAVMSGKKGNNGSATGHPESPAITVDASRLFADYEANEVSADEKYKGKLLEVSGVVDTIGKDLFDTIYVTLMVGGQFQIMKVQCFFGDESKSEAAKLSKGQRIVVRGECGGKSLNVVVKGCVFVK